jgi:Tol biopolymer transport system component
MPWPTPQDYNEAVQNPELAFADPELQVGRPELTPLGLPRAITGGFASVYKLQCPQRTWAVRCFLRQFHDYERRYDAISKHLARVQLPYTVGFTFLRKGISVRGQWYPILKMEWVPGEPLNVFLERQLENRSTLLSLAEQWVEMVKALQQASIAHGDLQHGNVLVVGEQLRLIDYDGMYVPALAGAGSHEVGHRNYQHPRRTESDFGPSLDNFSAWVVWVSLIAVAADPGLWRQFGGGDEALLFRRRDFEKPEASDVFRALERHRDKQIQLAVALLKAFLSLEPRDVPSLDGQILPITVPTVAGRTDGGSWIEDYVRTAPAPGGSWPGGSWIEDYVRTAPAPLRRAPIGPENVAGLVQLARLGNGRVSQFVFSPDGRLLAVASSLGTYLYDAETLAEVRCIQTDTEVLSVAFSPDGRLLASRADDGTVKLWEVATGREVRTLRGHTDWVRSVAFSPDGRLLASGADDGTVKLWEVATGREVRTLGGHTAGVESVAFSPDGRLLASGADDRTVKLWEVATGQVVRTLGGHTARVLSVAFSPDGRLLAAGSDDATVRLWGVGP